jgi:hypothetical protein
MATWYNYQGTSSSSTEYSTSVYHVRGYVSGWPSWPDADDDRDPLEEHEDFIQDQILELEEFVKDGDLEIDF